MSLPIAVLLGAVALATPVLAQPTAEPDVSHARVRIGPLAMNPTIELTNFGTDDNVFNDPEGQERSDFTLTLTPKTDAWLRVGRTWLTANVREDIVWYQTYSGERSGNTTLTGGWIVPLNRVALGGTASYRGTRERPGFEIDARAKRIEVDLRGVAEVRVLTRTFVGVRGGRQTTDFDDGEVFRGANLHDELNRTSTSAAIQVRHQLTPLTAIVVDAGRVEDDFDIDDLRDSTSTTAGVQVTFDPFALLKGSARIGFRDFEMDAADVPGFRGTTASVDLTYVLLGTTRFSVQALRDVQYSYDILQPYYLQTGVGGSLAQQIFGPVDVVGRAGVQHLAYRERAGAPATTGEVDRVHSYGGGLGYHLGSDLRIGVNVDRQNRKSEVASRRYEGLRIGGSVTYGF